MVSARWEGPLPLLWPLPSAVFNAYQGILPTWLYPFQFPDNTDAPAPSLALVSLVPLLTALMLTVLCVVVGYSAWSARIPRPAGDRSD